MSTNKTENYQLHAWEAGDDFLRSEINENFAAIDGFLAQLPTNKKLRIVTGGYTGDGVNGRLIQVGFRPKIVLVHVRPNGYFDGYALFLDGAPDTGSHSMGYITEAGFAVSGKINCSPTDGNHGWCNPHRYMAFDWEE